jgi:hypothetical protein
MTIDESLDPNGLESFKKAERYVQIDGAESGLELARLSPHAPQTCVLVEVVIDVL